MAYIYQITNDINQKVYIGKTEFSIEKDLKSIVKMLLESVMKNVHCMRQCENMVLNIFILN